LLDRKLSIGDWCSLAAECRLDGVDLMDGILNPERKVLWDLDLPAGDLVGTLIHPEVVKCWVDGAKRHGMALSTLTLHNTMLCFDEASRRREMDRLCVMLDLAKKLGIRTVRPVHGSETGLERERPDVEEKKMQAVIEMCRRLVPEAKKRGLIIAFEPHPRLTLKVANVVRLFNAVQDDSFKLQFDVKHVDCPPAKALATPGLLERLGGIHLDNYVVSCPYVDGNVSLLDGVLDFEDIFLLLRSIDYQGWATIEYCGTNIEHIRSSAAFVRALAHKYELAEP